MLNPERKGSSVWKLRMLAGVLALALVLGTAGAALGECRRAEEGSGNWWGVLYGDALLLVQAEEGEETPEDEAEVIFVWPLWEWLLHVLGLQ